MLRSAAAGLLSVLLFLDVDGVADRLLGRKLPVCSLPAEVLLRHAGVRTSAEAAAQRQPIAVPLAPVATGAPGAEEPESYVFSPSGIMLSRVRLTAPAAAAAGDSGARDDAYPEIQAAPAQQREHVAARAADVRHRRRGWRRRRAVGEQREAPVPEASAVESGERTGLPDPNTDWEREPRVRSVACGVGPCGAPGAPCCATSELSVFCLDRQLRSTTEMRAFLSASSG